MRSAPPSRRICAAAAVVLALASRAVLAGEEPAKATPEQDQQGQTAPEQAGAAPGGTKSPVWSYSLSGYAYHFSEEDDFALGIATADRGSLHLEARYNYEDLYTTSLWAGWNYSTGKTVEITITPMLGAVFGNTDAVAPGFEFSLAWKRLDYYLEDELVFDLNSSSDNFIYGWSELGLTPVQWLRCGLVGQRTRVYENDLDIQRGVFAQAILGPITIGVDWFNPGSDDSFTVAVLEVGF